MPKLYKRILIIWILVMLCLALSLGYWQIQRSNNTTPSTNSSAQAGTAFQNPVDISHVSLTNTNLGEVSFEDFKGDLVLAFFGYTNCPDVCPITLLDLADMQAASANPEELQVVMVTVDPARDNPELVQSYVENFDDSFIGLSGSNSEVADAMQAFYAASADQDNGLFAHTDVVFVIDKKGQLRRLYGQQDIDFLAADLPAFQKEQW